MKMIIADSDTVIATNAGNPGRMFRFGIGNVERGDEGRQEHGGPLVPGPWAYAYGLGVAICANPEMGTGAERERNLAAGREHDVEDGDRIQIDDVLYEIRPFRHGEYVKLVKVADLRELQA